MIGSFLRPKRRPDYYIPPFWGDGSDGILDDDASITYQDEVDFDKYSGFCVKQFKEVNWNPTAEETLTVDEPCRGLILFSQGNVYIGQKGNVSMAKKGSILPCNPEQLLNDYGASRQMKAIVAKLLTLTGGGGGDGGDGESSAGTGGTGGTGGDGRVCQGGKGGGPGGPAASSGYTAGNGGNVDYPEGPSKNGYNSVSTTGGHGWNGGSGGAGYNQTGDLKVSSAGFAYGAGPGAGSIASSPVTGGDGEHTGGLILIMAKGSITISGTMNVSGGNGGDASGSYTGGGGGGAGGGVIAVFAKGTITTTSAIKTLDGGAGGTGYQNGTAGGAGTYYEEQI